MDEPAAARPAATSDLPFIGAALHVPDVRRAFGWELPPTPLDVFAFGRALPQGHAAARGTWIVEAAVGPYGAACPCGLAHHRRMAGNDEALELAFALLPWARGAGRMAQALADLSNRLAPEHPGVALMATADPANIASCRTLLRAGFGLRCAGPPRLTFVRPGADAAAPPARTGPPAPQAFGSSKKSTAPVSRS